MPRGVRIFAAVASIAAAFVIGSASALAYQSGTIGFDISYPQCGTTYPTNTRLGAPPTVTPHSGGATLRSLAVATQAIRAGVDAAAPGPVPQSSPPSTTRVTTSPVAAVPRAFGIVGVDSGNPFISTTHPGNPCLADEYAHSPNPALYVNTGYDPSYEQPDHTTADCTTRSQSVPTDAAHRRAWAVGCSEAQKDLLYVTAQGIANKGGWWLDVEIGNSWCGLHGVVCDKTLNQYSIQGLIDTLLSNNATPVGIYSNNYMWSLIMGSNTVHGQTADWYATGQSTAQAAAPYCASGYSFAGDPVKLVQFVAGSVDRDLAC
jgi:hypothetical protein